MSIAWINPAALAGLALIALPIAIHLLVRQQTRSLPYPSLRFLRETALAAFRRRAVQDAGLLVCRVAVIAAAVTALAGPVLQSASRTTGYANRRSQAMIPVGPSASLAGAEDVFRSATFNRTMIADAIGDALRWLDAQPPSAREIVFGGSLRRGSIVETDLAIVPKDVGIRFVPDPAAAAPNQLTASVLTRRNGRLVRIDQLVHIDADSTRVSDTTMMAVPEDRLRVMAAAADQVLAEAALRAAVDEGVPWTTADRRLLLVWEGAAAGAAPLPGVDVAHMDAPSPPASAARAIWDAIDRATARPFVDPVLISREELQSWSRPPGQPSADAVPADEGDRRWWWAVGLALLGLEHFLRRERATARSTDAASAEARVA